DAPMLSYQANLQLGELLAATNRRKEAYALLQTAQRHLESLRGSMQGQELKIAFMKNRLAVYEQLVELSLAGESSREQAFQYIEQSKSRALSDYVLICSPISAPQERTQSSFSKHT